MITSFTTPASGPRRTRTRLAQLVALAVLVAGLAACDGGDDPGTAEATTSESSASASAEGGASDEASSEPATDAETTASTGRPSICGLEGVETGTQHLDEAPEVERWDYEGTVAYPMTTAVGPGASDEATGYQHCYQHTAAGALFAAAGAVATMTSEPETVLAWSAYFFDSSRESQEFLEQEQDPASNAGTRVEVGGFRLLEYDGFRARVDMALSGSSGGQSAMLSMVFGLVWEGGDWKLSMISADSPIDVAAITSLDGYVPFGPGATP